MNTVIDSKKQQILQEVFSELPFADWDERLFFKIEEKLGMVKNEHVLLYPSGIQELVDEYEQYLDELMLGKLKNISSEKSSKIRDKIKYAICCRLENDIPHFKLILAKTTKFYKKLNNLNLGLKTTWRTVDLMWKFAGDTSTDYNYYTKRGLLFGVYTATSLHYLKDESKGNEATWHFLDKRLNDILKINKLKKCLDISNFCVNNLPFIRQFK